MKESSFHEEGEFVPTDEGGRLNRSWEGQGLTSASGAPAFSLFI